jgi:hypothetical protein
VASSRRYSATGRWASCRLGAVDEIAGKGLQPLDLGPLLAALDRHPGRHASIILRAFIDANRGALRVDAA